MKFRGTVWSTKTEYDNFCKEWTDICSKLRNSGTDLSKIGFSVWIKSSTYHTCKKQYGDLDCKIRFVD